MWGAISVLPVPFAPEPFARGPTWPGAESGDGEAKDAHCLWHTHAEEPFQLEKGENSSAVPVWRNVR